MGPREEGWSHSLLRENLSISHNNLQQSLRNAACQMHTYSHLIISELVLYTPALKISFYFLDLFGKKLIWLQIAAITWDKSRKMYLTYFPYSSTSVQIQFPPPPPFPLRSRCLWWNFINREKHWGIFCTPWGELNTHLCTQSTHTNCLPPVRVFVS